MYYKLDLCTLVANFLEKVIWGPSAAFPGVLTYSITAVPAFLLGSAKYTKQNLESIAIQSDEDYFRSRRKLQEA